MRELIYYPGFEVKDTNWLKFALLYLDKLDPIVPETADHHLSDLYGKLLDETDLIKLHRPNDSEGRIASREALQMVEQILRRPHLYGFSNDVIELWHQERSQEYTLFEQKYSYEWEQFCLENRLARRTLAGIMLPKELGFIYMSFLAQTIADIREVSPITDYSAMDNLYMLARRADRFSMRKTKLAKASIALKLPSDIETIDINTVIRFRNRSGFKERLNAFHDELETFVNKVENWEGLPERDFLQSLGGPLKDFSDEVVRIGTNVLPFAVGAYLLATSTPTLAQDIARVAAAGISFTGGVAINLKNTSKITKSRRYCRKYVADLSKVLSARTH